MKELICPNCHKAFTVDEVDYASIVNQVKNTEFNEEVNRRIAELHEQHKAEQALATAKTEQTFQHQLSKKELELGAKDAEIERLKSEKESELTRLKSSFSAEIEVLKTQLENIATQKKNEMIIALAEKEQQISKLNSVIEQNDNKLQLVLIEERSKAQKEVQAKDTEISQLRSAVELEKREAQLHEASLIKHHENELRMKQDLVDYYKDLKTKMSTKMVGETLEQHCSIEFDQYIRPMMPTAYFEKDNDASDGTKETSSFVQKKMVRSISLSCLK